MQKTTKYLTATLLLVFVNLFCFSQINVDSLMKIILRMPNDTASIYKILQIGKNVEFVDLKLALDIYKQVEKKYGVDKYDSGADSTG